MAKAKKVAGPNDTPRIEFPKKEKEKLGYLKKGISKQEFEKAAHEVQLAHVNDQTSARDFGCKLLKLRLCMQHGDFTKWLRRNGIDQNRASYCMRVAEGKEGKTKKTATPETDSLQENIKWQLDRMYAAASQKTLTPDAMSVHAMEVVHGICARAGRMSGWTVQNPKDAKVAPLLTALKESLDNYLDALFADKKAKAAAAGS